MDEERHFSLEFSATEAGRLDRALARRLPQFSRTVLQSWLREGRVTQNATVVGATFAIKGGERIELHAPPPQETTVQGENIPVCVIYEDDMLLVIDKPAGLIVHPGAGCVAGTLQNALLYRAPELGLLPRSGIVHRLDKDTSGLLVIARTERARLALIDQLKTREMGREYRALVVGRPPVTGVVEAPIGRDPRHRTRMAVVTNGRPARTEYTVLERLGPYSLLAVQLRSGRTHQIRVHLTHAGFSLVGDKVYGGRALALLPRQALHAHRLTLIHPGTRERLSFAVPLPADFAQLLLRLRETAHG